MQAARRIYIYTILFVSLVMVAFGVMNLLGIILNGLWQLLGGSDLLDQTPEDVRQQLSLSIPFIVIAGPIWLIHWRLANGGFRRTTPEREADRRSPIRALYLALVLGASLLASILALSNLIRRLVEWAVGVEFPTLSDSEVITLIAVLLVAGGIWAAHVLFRQRDMEAGELHRAAVWLPRLYLYAAAGAGALMLLLGLSDLLEIAADAALGTGEDVRGLDPFTPDEWWQIPLVDAAGTLVTGAIVWVLHWRYSLQLLDRTDWTGRSERQSRLRLVYLVLFLLAGVLVAVLGAASAIETPLSLLLDVSGDRSDVEVAREIIVPLLGALPFAAIWWLHRRHLLNESRQYGSLEPDQAAGVSTYGVALVAIAAGGFGLAAALGIGLDLLFDGSRTDSISRNIWRADLAWFGGLAAASLALWGWQWSVVTRRMKRATADEQRSLVRRAYLYIVLAGSVVALLVPVAIVIYRLLERLFGVGQTGEQFVSDLSTPLGVVLVAALSAGYHGLLLWYDLQASEEEEAPILEPTVPARRIAVLEVTGPADGDLDAVIEGLRQQLPDGYEIRHPALDDGGRPPPGWSRYIPRE